jgi:hypothetical protein
MLGKHEFHLDSDKRAQATKEINRLGPIREEVVKQIRHRQAETHKEVGQAQDLFETLSDIHARETDLREKSGLDMPAPKFTKRELYLASDNITTFKSAADVRKLSGFEGAHNLNADPDERLKPAEGWGRAPARREIAGVFHHESSERLNAFKDRGQIQPLLIETSDGRLITIRLQDTKPQSILKQIKEQIARPFFENQPKREFRQSVELAFRQYHESLNADFERSRTYLEATTEIASAQAAERSLRAAERGSSAPSKLPPPEPVFTPKEEAIGERFAERYPDSHVHARNDSPERNSKGRGPVR